MNKNIYRNLGASVSRNINRNISRKKTFGNKARDYSNMNYRSGLMQHLGGIHLLEKYDDSFAVFGSAWNNNKTVGH